MNSCCGQQIEQMHDAVKSYGWFQTFLAASPFILLIPDFDPTVTGDELIGLYMKQIIDLHPPTATGLVQKRMNLPDFVDAVKAIGSMKYKTLEKLAVEHQLYHFGRGQTLEANFWATKAQAYSRAFTNQVL